MKKKKRKRKWRKIEKKFHRKNEQKNTLFFKKFTIFFRIKRKFTKFSNKKTNCINAWIQQISAHTGFKIRTFYNWANELKKDPNFDPLINKCGQQLRIFTDDEEDAITDSLRRV